MLEVFRNVVEIIGVKEMMDDFNERFKKEEDINKENYYEFMEKYFKEGEDWYFNDLNWKFIESEGDWNVYDEWV
jgi:hypothetical protein